MTEHQKALDKAKIHLMSHRDSAFFVHLCFSMTHVFDDRIPTACTDGMTIRYSPVFFMDQSEDERVFLLLHETLHVALQHILRRGDRDPRKWNIAADYVINYMLVKRGFKMPQGGLYDPKYDEEWTTAQVYDDLPEEEEALPNLPMDDVPESGGGDPTEGEGAPGDVQQNPLTQAQADALKDKIDSALMRAAMQEELEKGKGCGNIPGQLKFYIESLKTPKLPWNQILRKYMAKVVKRGYTWRRPNRRFMPKHYLPSRNSQALCDIAVAIDTSISVTDDEFHQFVSEAYTILKQMRPTSMTLVQFDTRIHKVEEIHTPKDLLRTEFHGRGGTDVYELLEWTNKHRPTVVLVFTDGMFHMHHYKVHSPMVWLINNNSGFRCEWGKVIHYDL